MARHSAPVQGHLGPITSLSALLQPDDGLLLVSTAADTHVRVWHYSSGGRSPSHSSGAARAEASAGGVAGGADTQRPAAGRVVASGESGGEPGPRKDSAKPAERGYTGSTDGTAQRDAPASGEEPGARVAAGQGG